MTDIKVSQNSWVELALTPLKHKMTIYLHDNWTGSHNGIQLTADKVRQLLAQIYSRRGLVVYTDGPDYRMTVSVSSTRVLFWAKYTDTGMENKTRVEIATCSPYLTQLTDEMERLLEKMISDVDVEEDIVTTRSNCNGRGLSRQFDNGLSRLVNMKLTENGAFCLTIRDTTYNEEFSVSGTFSDLLQLHAFLNAKHFKGDSQIFGSKDMRCNVSVLGSNEIVITIYKTESKIGEVATLLEAKYVTFFKTYVGELVTYGKAHCQTDAVTDMQARGCEVTLDLDEELGLNGKPDPMWMEGFQTAQIVAQLSDAQRTTIRKLPKTHLFSVRRSHDSKVMVLVMDGAKLPQIILADGKVQEFGPWMLLREVPV